MVNTYGRTSARKKLLEILDKGSFVEIDKEFTSKNLLHFSGYDEKLEKAKEVSGENESVICGFGRINRIKCIVIIFEPLFMMGSMGVVAAEKITHSFEIATRKKLPVISFSASSGIRLQEGTLALFQMVKTSGAVHKHSQKGLLYISVIYGTTLGGVAASFVSLADIIIADEGVQFGFTGKKIIGETFGEEISENFQMAHCAQKAGQVDIVVKSNDLRNKIISILLFHYTKKGVLCIKLAKVFKRLTI